MAELSKQALKVENQTNFPNNNTGYITPDLLRGFNTDMIDSNVNQSAYNTDSSSWNSSIANINAFTSSAQSLTTSSLLITASAAGNVITFTKGNGVNSRALNAMRVIGAAVFPDQPRNDQEIKENLYVYLPNSRNIKNIAKKFKVMDEGIIEIDGIQFTKLRLNVGGEGFEPPTSSV